MPPSSLSARERLELLIERFDQTWLAGSRPSLEDYLGDTALDRLVLLRELIRADIHHRRRLGEAVRVEEYLQRFPELADVPDAQAGLSNLGRATLSGPFPTFFGGVQAPAAGGSAGSLPEVVGRYRVDHFLASGGMGEVWRVLDGDFDRPLALKVLQERFRGHAELIERFLREARLTGQLQHPGIPPVHETGRLPDGRPYFIMKLVKGHSLQQLLRQRAAPPEKQTQMLSIFEHICSTVAYAHARGILHRDLKPGNVMVGAFGEVQVMDWGLAKVLAVSDKGGWG